MFITSSVFFSDSTEKNFIFNAGPLFSRRSITYKSAMNGTYISTSNGFAKVKLSHKGIVKKQLEKPSYALARNESPSNTLKINLLRLSKHTMILKVIPPTNLL